MAHARRTIAGLGAGLLLGALAIGGAPGLVAQEATPVPAEARPAHVHTGTCDNVGEVVGPLTSLTAPEGTAAGSEDAIQAEYSYTAGVALSLDAMLADDHVVNIHENEENIDEYIACGEVGGVIDANGSLVFGLSEQNGSGFAGVAFMTRSAADPATTDVSVFIAPDLIGAGDLVATPEAES